MSASATQGGHNQDTFLSRSTVIVLKLDFVNIVVALSF